jgi:hypothetical protein
VIGGGGYAVPAEVVTAALDWLTSATARLGPRQ